jgi:hypothetical protein
MKESEGVGHSVISYHEGVTDRRNNGNKTSGYTTVDQESQDTYYNDIVFECQKLPK